MKKIIAVTLFLSFLAPIAFAGPKKYSFVPSGEPQILKQSKSTSKVNGKTTVTYTPNLQIDKFEKLSEGPWIIEGSCYPLRFIGRAMFEHPSRIKVSFGDEELVIKKMNKMGRSVKVPFSKTFTLKTTPVSGLIWLETYDPSKEPKEPAEPSTWQSF